MQSLISVIVPVYKVEEYLDQCVSSIANQTYQNLEIILVDDGSPDRCPEMCDRWAEEDSRIKVVHKENGGLSDARNAGLKVATGHYVAFVDSDDLIGGDMVETLYNALYDTKADIAECDYVCFEDDLPHFEDCTDAKITSFSAEEALKVLLEKHDLYCVVWNKLYRRQLFNNLSFATEKLHEDVFFTYQAFGKSKSVVKIHRNMYYYRQRQNSIMGKSFSFGNLDALEAMEFQISYMERNYPKLERLSRIQLLGMCLYLGQKALKSSEKDTAMKKIGKIYRRNYRTNLGDIPIKQKIWLWIANFSVQWCCWLRNTLCVGV